MSRRTPVLTPGDGDYGPTAPTGVAGPAVQTLAAGALFAALNTSPRGPASADVVVRQESPTNCRTHSEGGPGETSRHRTGTRGYPAYVKGAPQEPLARCTAIGWRGERQSLTIDFARR